MPDLPEDLTLTVSPDRPWQMGLGGLITLPVAGLMGSSAVHEGSVLVGLIAAVVALIGAFGLAVFLTWLRGPYTVHVSSEGTIRYPTAFGTGEAEVELSEVEEALVDDTMIRLTLGQARGGVAWTKVIYGTEGIRALGAVVKQHVPTD